MLRIYPPDCLPELKKLVAEKKFGRSLGPDFDVMGVEGAQGGIGYTYLTFLDEGDEVIVTDPGYFHFVPAAETCGARIVPIELNAANGFKLQPLEVEAAITERTKMIVVCDPINPFGTVQTREELLAIADIARRRNIVIFNNVTHNTHQTDPSATQIPMASLHSDETPMDHVVSVSGMSKGYGMPAIRVGFMAGHPALLRGAFLTKMEITKIHINYPGQYAALAAMQDTDYVAASTETIRRNYAHIEETVARTDGVEIPVKPAYGFCMMIDVSGAGVTAQEVTVGLLKEKIAAIPGRWSRRREGGRLPAAQLLPPGYRLLRAIPRGTAKGYRRSTGRPLCRCRHRVLRTLGYGTRQGHHRQDPIAAAVGERGGLTIAVGSVEDPTNVRVDKVLTDEEQRLIEILRQRVGEAVTEIEPAPGARCHGRIAVRFAGNHAW